MAEKNDEQGEREPAPIKESDASRVSQEEAERPPRGEHAESEESETPNG